MPIGQLIYFPVEGEIENPYNKKKNANTPISLINRLKV
jgi:deoxycytidine triphosphate deaminase